MCIIGKFNQSHQRSRGNRRSSGPVGLGTRVIEKEGTTEIEELFEEEESSLMEVKETFDVLAENADGFIDADELRNAIVVRFR
ncbi:hypothetical protein V6N13_004687 [Hibiscus sabdariffa]|uniref:EF-hand domain-containing protein n=1 Tax=Hibiscus sabdariffa TaxID=183260 RepID=A0ABR2RZ96_9ROSI